MKILLETDLIKRVLTGGGKFSEMMLKQRFGEEMKVDGNGLSRQILQLFQRPFGVLSIDKNVVMVIRGNDIAADAFIR